MASESLNSPVVIVGFGQMGGVLATGFLQSGRPVYPVTRQMDLVEQLSQLPQAELVLIAVGEQDLDQVLDRLPSGFDDRVGLLQNELLPVVWKAYGLRDPTVMAAWFEKKKGQQVKLILPSVVFGPKADLIGSALEAVDIPFRKLADEQELLFELALKNLYILTINIAGLVAGGTVDQLRRRHPELIREVAGQVIDIQNTWTDQPLPRKKLLDGLTRAFSARPDQKCTGRSAPQRLMRALAQADRAGLGVPRLRQIQSRLGTTPPPDSSKGIGAKERRGHDR